VNNRFSQAFATVSAATLIAASLSACGGGGGGSSEAPPTDLKSSGGDGRIVSTFTAKSGVEYWLFFARDASLDKKNWISLPGGNSVVKIGSPEVLCAQFNDVSTWLAVDARTGGSTGGEFSPVARADTRSAGLAGSWKPITTAPTALNGVAFAAERDCPLTGTVFTGRYVAVGPAGALYTLSDTDLYNAWAGLAGATTASWTRATTPTGFSADLHAVAIYTSTLNATTPTLLYVAIGDGGAVLTSADAVTWTVSRAASAGHVAMRAIAKAGSTFVAVGDAGTIETSTDGITWTARSSNSGANLAGITYGNGRLVAVGSGGVLLTSSDTGVTWTAASYTSGSSATTANLSAVGYGSYNINGGTATLTRINSFVAVGAGGAVVRSTDGGATWTDITATAGVGGVNLNAVSYTSRFVALDASGQGWSSVLGDVWANQGAVVAGATALAPNNATGYVAIGAGGAASVAY